MNPYEWNVPKVIKAKKFILVIVDVLKNHGSRLYIRTLHKSFSQMSYGHTQNILFHLFHTESLLCTNHCGRQSMSLGPIDKQFTI